jgi:hypothetical protein
MRILLAALLSVALIWLAPAKQDTSGLNIDHTAVNVEQARKPVTEDIAPLQEKTPEPVVIKSEPAVIVQPAAKPVVPEPQPNTPQAWMDTLGIPENERPAVNYINSQESGWCPTKWEGEYGACPAYHGVPTSNKIGYGLCQATPASKMASAGADWQTNPVTQLKWCAEHAKGYGGWQKAAEFKRCVGTCYSTKIAKVVTKRTPYW